jgi:RND family efflux transporter MFP subunit
LSVDICKQGKTMNKLLLCSLVFIFCLTACSEEKKIPVKIKPRPVKAIVVGEKKKLITREFTGKTLATVKAELSFEVPGRLIKLPVKESTEKQKGELIAAIDPKRYEDKVNQEKAKYDLAKAQFDRAKALIKQNFISKNDYDILESQMNIAKANLSTAKKNLRDTVLYAPFDGFVAKKYVDNFEYVKAKEPIVSFHDVEDMDVEIQIPEYIILQIKDGAAARPIVVFEGVNKEYLIKFKEFSSKADPDTQTYRAVYTLKAPKEINILPGMSVTVKFNLPDYKNDKKTFYLIPASAVFSGTDNKPNVWIIDKNTKKIKAKNVVVANMTGENIKVLEGLNRGDEIVVAGVSFLRAGEKVYPIESKK